MKVINIVDEDFTNYKKPSMFIAIPYCDFKCCKEADCDICQNSSLATAPVLDVLEDDLIKRYLANDITKAIVFGGLDPLYKCTEEIVDFIHKLRYEYKCNDDIVIYTGYKPDEKQAKDAVFKLSNFTNIIIKYGRYIPNDKEVYDRLLGVKLASSNQFARRL